MSRSTSSKKSSLTPKSRTDLTPKKGTTTHGYTMLMIRVEEGNLNDVKAALKQYPEETVNDQNKHGQTALALAARNGNSTICEFLITEGADVNLPNKSGQSPLFIACSYNHFEIANLLLYHGANVNTADSRGWTPLMSACQNSNLRLVELLLTYKADITPIDRFGKRARERTKDPKITRVLDEMERQLELMEEMAKYNTPRRKTSRSRSKGSAGRQEGDEEEPQNEEEYDGTKHLDSTLRACPQFVSDMEIYKMHKRAGYYKYHKAGDPRNLHPASAASLRRKRESFDTALYDRNFNSALKSPFNNDLLSCISRGRPLTGRTGTPKLNESKLSNPLKDERRAKSGSAKRASEIAKLKNVGSPIVNQISQSFIDNMKKFSQSKEANPFKRQNDSNVKTVVKPRRSLIEVFEDEVTDSDEEECQDVMNDELKTLYSLFVKKLAKRTEKNLNKKVTFMLDKEAKENNGPVSQERREQIISQKGAEIEGKTISDFNDLLTHLLNSYKLGDDLAQTVREGTETIINRVTALAQHNLFMSPSPRREIDFDMDIMQKAPLPINPEAIPAFLEERMTEKVKGELYTKLDEIFEVLDEALINKPDDQQSQLTRNFRSQALKALNKLRMDLLDDLLIKTPPSMEQVQDHRDYNRAESTTSIEKGLSRKTSTTDVEKVKGEINDKLEEIFKILDEACFNKPEGEKAQFLKGFRSEVMKALNKIRAGFVDDLLRGRESEHSGASSPVKDTEGKAKEEVKIFIVEAPGESEGAYTRKLREEVNKKMNEIYEILDEAIEGKSDEEKELCLRDFRSESLKSLNKLRVYLLHDLLLKMPTVNFEKISQDDSKEFLQDLHQRKKSDNSSQLRKHLDMAEKPQNNSSEASGNFRYASTALNSIDVDELLPHSLLVQPANPFGGKGGHKKGSPIHGGNFGKESTNTLVLTDEEQVRRTPKSSSRYEENPEEESPNMIEKIEESGSDNEGILAVKLHKSPEGYEKAVVEESLNDLEDATTVCRTGENVHPTMNTELCIPSTTSEIWRKESEDIKGKRPAMIFTEACHAGELENDADDEFGDVEEVEELSGKPVVQEALESADGVGPMSDEIADKNQESEIAIESKKTHNKTGDVINEEEKAMNEQNSHKNQESTFDVESNKVKNINPKIVNDPVGVIQESKDMAGEILEMILAEVEGCIAEKLFRKSFENKEEEGSQYKRIVVQRPSGNAGELESDDDDKVTAEQKIDEGEGEKALTSRSIEKVVIMNAGELENDYDDESPEAAMRLIANIKSELASNNNENDENIEENTYEYSRGNSRENYNIGLNNKAGDLESDNDDSKEKIQMTVYDYLEGIIAKIEAKQAAGLLNDSSIEESNDIAVPKSYAGELESDNSESGLTQENCHSSANKNQTLTIPKAHHDGESEVSAMNETNASESLIQKSKDHAENKTSGVIPSGSNAGALESDNEECLRNANKKSSSIVDNSAHHDNNMRNENLKPNTDGSVQPMKTTPSHFAGELESDGESQSSPQIEGQKITHNNDHGNYLPVFQNNKANVGAILIQDMMNTEEEEKDYSDVEEISAPRKSQQYQQIRRSNEEDDEVNLGESHSVKRTNTKSSDNNTPSQISGTVYEREMVIEDSDFMAMRRREIHEAEIGKLIDDIQTIASEVIYNRPSDLSDMTIYRRADTGNTFNTGATGREGILERTETRESEVLYKYDEEHSAQLREEMTIQNKYKMLDVVEDPMEKNFNPGSGYESVVRFEGLDGENNSYGTEEVRYEKTEEDQPVIKEVEENEDCGSAGIEVQVQDIEEVFVNGSCVMNPEEKRREIIQAAAIAENRRRSIKENVKDLIKRAIEERARDKIFEKQREVGQEGIVNPVRLSVGSNRSEDEGETKQEGKVHSVPASLTGIPLEEIIPKENKARRVKTVTFKTMSSMEEDSMEEFDCDKEQNEGEVRMRNKIEAEKVGKLILTRDTITHTVKAFNSRFDMIIPKPAPSRTVKEIKVMRIDEIPYCENFHYLGQSKKGRSLSMAFPKKVLYEKVVGKEEIVFERAKDL